MLLLLLSSSSSRTCYVSTQSVYIKLFTVSLMFHIFMFEIFLQTILYTQCVGVLWSVCVPNLISLMWLVHLLPPSDRNLLEFFLHGFFIIILYFTKELLLQKLHVFPRSVTLLQFMIPIKVVLTSPSPHKFVGLPLLILEN